MYARHMDHWDEFLPDELAREIGAWFSELKELENVKISRGLRESGKECFTCFCGCLSEGIWSSGVYEIRI